MHFYIDHVTKGTIILKNEYIQRMYIYQNTNVFHTIKKGLESV